MTLLLFRWSEAAARASGNRLDDERASAFAGEDATLEFALLLPLL